MEQDCVLKIEGATKLYPGVIALQDVDFELRKGEVHAMVGENGAGKSTLIKILAGSVRRDSGVIRYLGKEYDNYTTSQALDMGISVIHQEFNLVPYLNVAQNVFLGKEIKRGPFLDKKAMREATSDILKKMKVNISPDTKVNQLSVAYQQITEIAKAVKNKSTVVVMDEPSAALTESELEVLFEIIREFRSNGISVIYISHRLEEIFGIADRVTVLRDGRRVETKNVADTSKEELISMMVGRELSGTYPKETIPIGEPVLQVEQLSNDKVRDVCFTLHKSEILGLSGLVGSGRTEIVRSIFGVDTYTGEILLHGKSVKIKSPSEAIRLRIGLLPEDRKRQGLLLKMSVRSNESISMLEKLCKGPFVDKAKENEVAEKYTKTLRIKTPGLNQKAVNLSGGNQQKVVLAKWLATDSDIIIFDEPTRGIDVGAKQEIYALMTELVKEGKSIIMISSDMPELIGMSDRIVVMSEGLMMGEMSRAETTQERLLELASGMGGNSNG